MDDTPDTPESIRQQMEETKSQLNEKLESLELQVAETVQTTGTAVNATVEAVQVTVETVTGAVQDAVHSVSNAFDIRLQLDRHPWMVFGGAVVMGYLAVEYLTGPAKNSERPRETALPLSPPANSSEPSHRDSAVESTATASAIAASYESGRRNSSWHQLRDVALGALIGVVQDVVSRATPRIVDYLTGEAAKARLHGSDQVEDGRSSSNRIESLEAAHRLPIASSGIARSGNSF